MYAISVCTQLHAYYGFSHAKSHTTRIRIISRPHGPLQISRRVPHGVERRAVLSGRAVARASTEKMFRISVSLKEAPREDAEEGIGLANKPPLVVCSTQCLTGLITHVSGKPSVKRRQRRPSRTAQEAILLLLLLVGPNVWENLHPRAPVLVVRGEL